MGALEALLWAVAVIVGILAFALVLGAIILVAALIYGFSAWRKGEENDEKESFKGRGTR